MKRPAAALVITIALILLTFAGCKQSDPSLKKASSALSSMSTKGTLSRSCFYVVHPDGKPTDFVDYLFSELASAEWPPVEGGAEAKSFGELPRQSGRGPYLPADVSIVAHERSSTDEKQLVLVPDDENGVVLVKGYLAGESEPDLSSKWYLASAKPGKGVEQMCQSNLQMGMNPRSQ